MDSPLQLANSSYASYKSRHEEFVAGLTGGSIFEIYIVTLVAVSGVFTWSALQSRLFFFSSSNWIRGYFTDFSLNWLALLFSITIYSSMPALLNFLVTMPGFILLSAKSLSRSLAAKSQQLVKKFDKQKKNDLAEYLT